MILMNNIFKQFVAWATNSKDSHIAKATVQLTMYYTAGVVIVIALFSFLVFSTFTRDIDARSYDDSTTHQEDNFREEIKENLFDVIIFFDIIFIILAIVISFFLSKRTLQPLEQARLQQKRFVADAAHELRNPLAVMKAGAEVVLHKERTPAEYQKFIHEFQDEVQRLSILSENLLFLAQDRKITIGSMAQFSLSQLCQSMIQQLSPYADTRGITLTYQGNNNVGMFARKEDITRLLLNLFKNAIDYNKQGGTVLVTARNNEGYTVIDVQDTGIGIAEKDIHTIFDRFFKIDTARQHSQHSGTGLGLSLVKDIVDQYKGVVSVISKEGVGSTFTVKIPSQRT